MTRVRDGERLLVDMGTAHRDPLSIGVERYTGKGLAMNDTLTPGATHTPWELAPEQTRNVCDPARFSFTTSDSLPEPRDMPAQRRAQEAISFALEMGEQGYHLTISGKPGSGRLTAALKSVETAAESRAAADDWCYVHNFEQPSEPRAIRLPAGGGQTFARQVEHFVGACRGELRRALRSEAYRQQRAALLKDIGAQHDQTIERLQQEGLSHGFLVQATPQGLMVVPVEPAPAVAPDTGDDARRAAAGGERTEPLSPEEFAALPKAQQERIRAERDVVSEAIARALPQLQALEEKAGERVRELNQTTAHQALGRLTERLVAQYADEPRIADYLRHVENDIVAHVDVLIATAEEHPGEDNAGAPRDKDAAQEADSVERDGSVVDDTAANNGVSLEDDIRTHPALTALLRRYAVNALVTHRSDDHAPVVQELNPTFPNLVGRVEFGLQAGLPFTDHLMIKAGALHHANGGYLILQARDLLGKPDSWGAVKRALRFDLISIESDGEARTMPASASLRPEPIPVRMKLVLIGEPEIFDALTALDPEFSELFTVRAEFDTEAPRTVEVVRFYAEFTGHMARVAAAPGFAPDAVSLLVEEGSRWVGDQERVSAHLRSLQHLILEAGRMAQGENATVTRRTHVERAIAARERRLSFVSDKLDEMIDQRTIMIDTEGAVVGQVNGMTILSTAEYSFGKPARITARTAPGLAGIVNLERETAMSGPAHAKGILILGGYLAGRFARDYPLCLAGSICFEQVYGEIEGDSASSAELYALLSSLAGVPIKQSLAVTGSVNQRGEVQPVGMVTEKVEGFFDVCRRRGLTGAQGVVIPRANVRNLMLREDVVGAIRTGQFHVYAVSAIDEGIEILTGMPAGLEGAGGQFPEGTVNQRVGQTLRQFAERMRDFQAGSGTARHVSPFADTLA